MVKNIIFDIGNVLVLFDETNHANKLFGKETASRILDGLWRKGIGDDFDLGILEETVVIEKYISILPDLEKEILKYIDTVGECISLFNYAISWINEMKALGYKVYFLSNYSKWFMRSNPKVLDFTKYMDGGVFSCDCHHVKPEKEIFEILCNKYDLNKKECFFIDDLKRNIDAATLYGFKGYQFIDYDSSYKEIMAILEEDRRC